MYATAAVAVGTEREPGRGFSCGAAAPGGNGWLTTKCLSPCDKRCFCAVIVVRCEGTAEVCAGEDSR